jgi:hypothetical protein
MNRGARIGTVLLVLVALSLSSCGGGGGGSSASPYTGLATPAVVTASNADNVARQAFQGGDLGANVTLAPARSGDARAVAGQPMAARPAALTLVQILTKVSTAALPPSPAGKGPSPRAVVTESGVIDDGWGQGGQARYTISADNVSGVFTGTFVFDNFHGDGGGTINGNVGVSGVVSQDSMQILFDFHSVRMVDGAEDVTAIGTVELVSGTAGGNATLDIVFRDNANAKTVWLSNFTVGVTEGTGSTDVRMFGRIYLHDYGYVDIHTEAGFIYPTGSTLPTSGAITLTGSNNCRARLTVVDATTYTVELDADGNGSYEWTVTHAW